MPIDAKCPIYPPLSLLRWSSYLPHRWPCSNIFLLWRQCLEYYVHTAQLVLPMVTSYDGCEATLGCSLQGDIGGDIPDGYDDSVGSVGTWFGGIQRFCSEADVREGAKRKPNHVLKSVDTDSSKVYGRGKETA
jgi:hypothetical protein